MTSESAVAMVSQSPGFVLWRPGLWRGARRSMDCVVCVVRCVLHRSAVFICNMIYLSGGSTGFGIHFAASAASTFVCTSMRWLA